jgi:hypothetical protein
MRELTQEMIRNFKIMKLGVDFMGYIVHRKESLSFHHLIIPRRESHEYLHLIESKDYDKFAYITSEMIDENIKGRIDEENLKRIDDVLTCFEKEYGNKTNKKGKYLIKREYIVERKNKLY